MAFGDADRDHLVHGAPSTLLGQASLPAKSFADLRNWIATDPAKVNLAHAGAVIQAAGAYAD